MKMRLKGLDTPSDLRGAAAGARPVLHPWIARARAGLDHAAPYKDRLLGEIRKHPKLGTVVDAVANRWATLVESFCGLIDPYLSRYFPDMRLVAVVTASADVELHKIVNGVATPMGLLAAIDPAERTEIAQAKWTGVELRLPPDQLLQRTLSLPAASRDFLGPIIEHRLERLTPWRPDHVLYGYRTLAEAEPGGGVSVALTATSKDFVAAPLQALDDAGLLPTAIGAQEDSLSEPLRVNLFRGAVKAARLDSRRMVSRVALASFAILAAAWLGSSLWASSALERQQEAGVELMKARRLLTAASMGAIGDRERALLETKQPNKAVVVLIDKLANAIPEDTFLKELAVTPDKVRLAGISGNAPALVRELESTGLVNVRFASAVTREKNQKDSFEITSDRAAAGAADAP